MNGSDLRRVGAAAAAAVAGVGFGVPGVIGAVHTLRTDEVWTFLGFPTYAVGDRASVPPIVAFCAVCAGEVVVGALIARRSRRARVMSWGLVPFELVAWSAFALPIGFVLGAIRVWLLGTAGGAPAPGSVDR